MSEWLKEHAWKACVGETLPWVRIPLSPPAPSPAARSPAARVVSRRRATRCFARRAWHESPAPDPCGSVAGGSSALQASRASPSARRAWHAHPSGSTSDALTCSRDFAASLVNPPSLLSLMRPRDTASFAACATHPHVLAVLREVRSPAPSSMNRHRARSPLRRWPPGEDAQTSTSGQRGLRDLRPRAA